MGCGLSFFFRLYDDNFWVGVIGVCVGLRLFVVVCIGSWMLIVGVCWGGLVADID